MLIQARFLQAILARKLRLLRRVIATMIRWRQRIFCMCAFMNMQADPYMRARARQAPPTGRSFSLWFRMEISYSVRALTLSRSHSLVNSNRWAETSGRSPEPSLGRWKCYDHWFCFKRHMRNVLILLLYLSILCLRIGHGCLRTSHVARLRMCDFGFLDQSPHCTIQSTILYIIFLSLLTSTHL